MQSPWIADPPPPSAVTHFMVEAYNVRIRVEANSRRALAMVKPRLPPGWMASLASEADQTMTLTTDDGFYFNLAINGEPAVYHVELEAALDLVEHQLRFNIAQHAPDLIFVHAGAVGYHGRAILLPGETFTGKTTLVTELVRAGADYYSDDYAVLAADGLLRPYAKPLSIREGGIDQVDHDVSAFGGKAGVEPIPVGLVVVTSYAPTARWEPKRLSPGDGVLALLAHTVPAQDRPDEALQFLSTALAEAVVLESERGEAAALVPEILEAVPA